MHPMISEPEPTLPIRVASGGSPLREPAVELGPVARALDLLDCIDEAQSWAEAALSDAERVARSLPSRAAALSMTTPALRELVAACVGESPYEPWALVPTGGERLVRDLLVVGEALATVGSRSRAAAKHVMRLALAAPGLAQDARHSLRAADEGALLTHAWLDGLSGRARDLGERSRMRLGGLPTRADALRSGLRRVSVAPPARRRSRVPTDKLFALALAIE